MTVSARAGRFISATGRSEAGRHRQSATDNKRGARSSSAFCRKQRLGVEREPYLILGASYPSLAHQALGAEPELGTLVPCNALVYEEQGVTHVAAVDAEQMLSIVANDELTETGSEVRWRLCAVVDRAAHSSADRAA